MNNNYYKQKHTMKQVEQQNNNYASVGGRLTIPLTGVGFDPSPELLQQRNLAMNREVLTPDELFSATVNGYH